MTKEQLTTALKNPDIQEQFNFEVVERLAIITENGDFPEMYKKAFDMTFDAWLAK